MKKQLLNSILFVLLGTSVANASNMDHSKMDHSKMTNTGMDHSKMNNTGMDHSKMNNTGMDHSKMNNTGMDHSKMNNTGMDHSKMNHTGMDHSKMNHSMSSMQGMSEVGMPAKGAKADKIIYVMLTDKGIEFKKEVELKSNEVVEFVVMNMTDEAHRFVIGSPSELNKVRSGEKAIVGSELLIPASKVQKLLWHLHGSKLVEIACIESGHQTRKQIQIK